MYNENGLAIFAEGSRISIEKRGFAMMYRLFVLIGLVFTYLGSVFSGFFGTAKPAEIKTVPVNGSLSAVDALGRRAGRL